MFVDRASAMAMAAQLVPAAEIHWCRPWGKPVSLGGCTGKVRVRTSQEPSGNCVRSRNAMPR